MSTFGGLDVLFNPAKRHLDEEKLRLQSTREEIGDASGGKRIDLDSGRVKIPKAQGGDDAEADIAGDDPADDPDAPVVATTKSTVRADADADADPAAASDPVAEVEENTPAARARRRRAKKA